MDRALQHRVRRRAQGRCEYCRTRQTWESLPFEIDHILAESHGGQTVAGNLALACFVCNRFKGPNLAGIDPQTGRLTRLFNPRLHKWMAHFQWRGAWLHGRTAIGRATIAVLHINDSARVWTREQLIAEGKTLG